jgi:hypothetical protein
MVVLLKRVIKFSLVVFLIVVLSFLAKRVPQQLYLGLIITFVVTFLLHQKTVLAFLSACTAQLIFPILFLSNLNELSQITDLDNLKNSCTNYYITSTTASLQTIIHFILVGIVGIFTSAFKYTPFERRITNLVIFYLETILYIIVVIPSLTSVAIFSRLKKHKLIDVGIGPQPLINNVYHKKAVNLAGYSAETFVENVYFITSEFDYRGDQSFFSKYSFLKKYANIPLFIRAIFRYKCLYIYFTGGPLRIFPILKPVEPYLLKLAGVKVVVMPYGADVNDMHFGPNYKFKHALNTDYPSFHKLTKDTANQISRWTENADYVISGCDWVDYTYYWDKLVLAHFSVDVEKIIATSGASSTPQIDDRVFTKEKPLRVFHAPNHKTIKGSRFIQQAITELQSEGYPIEISLVQGKPNNEILQEIAKSDIVADQLVIGWYAMFALEGLSLSKPVICYLREDLIELFLFADVLHSKDELPFLNANVFSIKNTLRDILIGKIKLSEYASRALPYVKKYHSVEAVGNVFKNANKHIGL